MSPLHFPLAIRSCALFAALCLLAETASAGEPFVAEVTSRQVNVRSGPSTNYYVTTRLSAGDRVQVVGEENGWYAVLPPAGCYSLISKDYVEIGPNGEGTVTGNAVRVRAGSELDKQRYAVQLKLDKGAQVRSIGETDEDFIKIVPPEGAQLWIHADYAAPVPADRLDAQTTARWAAAPQTTAKAYEPPVTPTAPPPAPSTAARLNDAITQRSVVAATTVVTPRNAEPRPVAESVPAPYMTAPIERSSSGGSEPIFAEVNEPIRATPAPVVRTANPPPSVTRVVEERPSDGQLRAELERIDALMKAEMSRPIDERQLDQIMAMYQPIASQDEDIVARLYAKRRIEQLESVMSAAAAVRQIRSLNVEVSEHCADSMAKRRALLSAAPVVAPSFDALGELRRSMIFSSPVGPQRYRLVDAEPTTPRRTVCYIELPPDSQIDISRYIGRLVGVKARDRYLETGDVNPIPIIVAEELVALGSPKPPQQAAPAPQPALTRTQPYPVGGTIPMMTASVDTNAGQ